MSSTGTRKAAYCRRGTAHEQFIAVGHYAAQSSKPRNSDLSEKRPSLHIEERKACNRIMLCRCDLHRRQREIRRRANGTERVHELAIVGVKHIGERSIPCYVRADDDSIIP